MGVAPTWLACAVLGCGVPSPFACADDSQCALDGALGICTEQGHCAYPDPDCASGWGYPAGAAGIGGECAAGGPLPTTGDSDSTDPTVAGSTSTTGPNPSTSTSTSTTTTGPITTTGATTGDGPTSGSSGEPSSCPDPYPNDTAEGLPALPVDGETCNLSVTGQVDDMLPSQDWFRVVVPASCRADFGGTFVASLDLAGTICVFTTCTGVGATCLDKTPAFAQDGLLGCCADSPAQAGIYALACETGDEYFIEVVFDADPGDDVQTCATYDVNASAGP